MKRDIFTENDGSNFLILSENEKVKSAHKSNSFDYDEESDHCFSDTFSFVTAFIFINFHLDNRE